MSGFECKDITGKRYGKLVAFKRTDERDKRGSYKWMCLCDCGNFTVVSVDNLRRNGGTQSCGCSKKHETISIEEYENKKREELARVTSDWEYICCYNRDSGKHIIKCRNCGIERKVNGLFNIPTCKTCLRLQKKQEEEQSKYKVCVVCGVTFKPQRSTAMYCSERCSGIAYNARHSEKVREKRKINKRLREARATSNGKVDYSITLTKLIERDNHICRLCGREVNESDYTYVGDTFIAGNDYPSIDHIKPLSKGGVHQWDNVQLAHRLCNSLKNNK